MRISDWSSDVCSSDLITQNKTRPPTFVLFGTRLDELPESYRRYLVNGIRKELGFGAVPVRLTLRSAKKDRKSVVSGKSVSVRVDLGGRRIIKQKIIEYNRSELSTSTQHKNL